MPSRFQAPTPPVCRATKVTPAPSAATLFYRGAQRHLPEVHDLREYKWMFVRTRTTLWQEPCDRENLLKENHGRPVNCNVTLVSRH